jgi:hypothetical protein
MDRDFRLSYGTQYRTGEARSQTEEGWRSRWNSPRGARGTGSHGGTMTEKVDELFAPWDKRDSPGCALARRASTLEAHGGGIGSHRTLPGQRVPLPAVEAGVDTASAGVSGTSDREADHGEKAMTNTIAPGTGHIGNDPFVHMTFLISSPARVLALRLAMSRVIREDSVMLDAGCGALGLLAIMAARLGAARVVAVDVGPLDFAQRLAAENGVSDRIDFIQGDLHDVALPVKSFDVIVGMIYNNEVKRDLGQQNLMNTLVKRHGHSETAIIPNTVRYSVAGYDCPSLDDGKSKQIVEWETHVENTERHTGITFSALRELLDQVPPLFQIMGTPRRGAAYNQVGYFDRSSMTLLTERKLFTEIDYNLRSDSLAYPASMSLPVAHAGRLNVITWQQDLVFDDILIRTTESMNPVIPAALVEAGDRAVLSTGADWQYGVPLKVEKR